MAAGTTYEPIATQTLGSATATVTFSSISSAYTDLVLICSVTTSGPDYIRVQVGNGSADTGTNYSSTNLGGNGSTATSYRYSNSTNAFLFVNGTLSSTDPAITITQFQNYANTSIYKTFLNRGSLGTVSTEAGVNLWRSTSAINVIKLFTTGYNMNSGSTFTLYGIKAA
jgi:hypothetical protein